MARCVLCDYCDTAESLSRVSERVPIRLIWNDVYQGYTCENLCLEFDAEVQNADPTFLEEDE